MRTLNLGILAHVDAGKTTLTERLLYAAGAIDALGSVDAGTTRTDTMALERDRGITIRSAVASFAIDDVTVNLIDTPGHPDFIAEVERVLGVLDGVVLVVSAVEGVQPQTRILMRTLRRLRIPTMVFVNKIDRAGAQDHRLLEAIAAKLTPSPMPMGSVRGLGSPTASFAQYASGDAGFRSDLLDLLTGYDDGLLAMYLDDDAAVTGDRLRAALAAQVERAHVHPVIFGSAMTGAGVNALLAGIAELLPAADGDVDAPASGTVFKVERDPAGDKTVYVRMFAGTVRVRDRVPLGEARGPSIERDETGEGREGKVTRIGVVGRGSISRSESVSAGQIGLLRGLGDARVGDSIGQPPPGAADDAHFAPPTLETGVVPRCPRDRGALHVALTQLAEQDPLINVRHDERRSESSVSLYGEVQKEVIQATLANEYGLDVGFRESTTICVERPIRSGEAVEILNAPDNPFSATIGLRLEPAPPGAGVEFRLRVHPRAMPLYLSKTADNFAAMMSAYVRRALREGRHGWRVVDCVVTMVECTYSSTDGPPSTRGPLSTTADFRDLTPVVVMRALERAGTRVCEPIHRFRLEVPVDALGAVLPALSKLRADLEAPVGSGASYLLQGDIPAARVHALRQRLPALTGGEGVLESDFDHYRPVRGDPPTRSRQDPDPRDRKAYLRSLRRRF